MNSAYCLKQRDFHHLLFLLRTRGEVSYFTTGSAKNSSAKFCCNILLKVNRAYFLKQRNLLHHWFFKQPEVRSVLTVSWRCLCNILFESMRLISSMVHLSTRGELNSEIHSVPIATTRLISPLVLLRKVLQRAEVEVHFKALLKMNRSTV